MNERPLTLSATPGGREAHAVVLVVAVSEEASKRVESFLRNAGHPIRTAWVTDLEDLEDALKRNPPDAVLCHNGVAEAAPADVVRICRERAPGLPVLVVGDRPSVGEVARTLAMGARDLVSDKDAEHLSHLELAVIRELNVYQDVRSLRLASQRLADFESRHLQLRAETADALAHVQEGIVQSANPAFARLLGYETPEPLAGQPLIDLVVPEQQSKIKERLRAVLKGKHNGEPLELALLATTGKIDVSALLILGRQDGESVIELLIRAPSAGSIATMSASAGRGAFAAALAQPLLENRVRAALLLRLDHFAELETRLGPIDAEEVVLQLTAAVRTKLVAQDQLFAFSADELAILAERPTVADIERFGADLRQSLSGIVVATRRHEAQIALSLAIHPVGPTDQADAVARTLAQEARSISGSGGNRTVVLGTVAQAAANEREMSRKSEQLRKALADGRLKLAYQSIASLEGSPRSHFDVLVRMLDEQEKELHASEFLPVADKLGLMKEIDRFVVGRVLQVIAKRGEQQSSVLFVKLSDDSVHDTDNFLAWLRDAPQKRPFQPDEIVFELRERSIHGHTRKAKVLIDALREMGAAIAIDYFGHDPQSMQLLHNLPIQFVKFDPSFSQNFTDKQTYRKLSELMETAKQKGIKTVVSHVEDSSVMARVWQMGANFVQGYHVQEPEVVLLSSEAPLR